MQVISFTFFRVGSPLSVSGVSTLIWYLLSNSVAAKAKFWIVFASVWTLEYYNKLINILNNANEIKI